MPRDLLPVLLSPDGEIGRLKTGAFMIEARPDCKVDSGEDIMPTFGTARTLKGKVAQGPDTKTRKQPHAK
jgi:hypothetical protein